MFKVGTVVCSGDTRSGGDAGSKQKNLVDVKSIAHTRGAFAARKGDGTVVVWGNAEYGGEPGDKQSELVDIVSIGSGDLAFAAMKSDGRMICWGDEGKVNDAIVDCKWVIIYKVFKMSEIKHRVTLTLHKRDDLRWFKIHYPIPVSQKNFSNVG